MVGRSGFSYVDSFPHAHYKQTSLPVSVVFNPRAMMGLLISDIQYSSRYEETMFLVSRTRYIPYLYYSAISFSFNTARFIALRTPNFYYVEKGILRFQACRARIDIDGRGDILAELIRNPAIMVALFPSYGDVLR